MARRDLSTQTEAQAARVLARLREGPATTVELREELDVMHPAGRVRQLREHHTILMAWVHRPTAAGVLHRVGMYVLQPVEA